MWLESERPLCNISRKQVKYLGKNIYKNDHMKKHEILNTTKKIKTNVGKSTK